MCNQIQMLFLNRYGCHLNKYTEKYVNYFLVLISCNYLLDEDE